jgi:hypothetical protein
MGLIEKRGEIFCWQITDKINYMNSVFFALPWKIILPKVTTRGW